MLPLETGQIHLWLADQDSLANDISSSQRKQCLSWLAENEMARYQRFLYAKHKNSFLLTRALSRSILSHYVADVDPADWQFVANDYGKPQIAAPRLLTPIYFNISHSANKLVMALSRHDGIGVDVETTKKTRETLKIGHRYFSEQEHRELCEQPKELVNDRFYDLWTLKEAYIKACGMGLAISLQQFSFDFQDAGKIRVNFSEGRVDDPTLWQFWQFAIDGDYKLALALKSAEKISSSDIVMRQLSTLTQFSEVNPLISSSS